MPLTDLDLPPGVTCVRFRRLPRSKRCQYYSDGGSCALADGFMCGEWIKRNPSRATGYHVSPDFDPDLARARVEAGEQTEREHASKPTASRSEEPSTNAQPDPLELDDETAPTRLDELADPNASLPGFDRLDVTPTPYQPGAAPPKQADASRASPSKSSTAATAARRRTPPHGGTAPRNRRPAAVSVPAEATAPPVEVATPEHVDALTARDLEVTLEAEAGFDLTLVPRYTHGERLELTYRDAATLANVLSIFPDARVKAIKPCETTKTNSKPETPTPPRP